jgi:hypothetical protein
MASAMLMWAIPQGPPMKIYFNKEQKEGLARFCDTLSVSSTIGWIVAISGYNKLTLLEVCILAFATPSLLFAGYLFRRTT